MRAFWTLAAVLGALLVQSAMSQIAPAQARLLDPFLLVLVYCGLTGGETHGMLAGAIAGWVQDVHFGGSVLGLEGLTKVIVGFGVGLAGARFLLAGAGPRLLVLFGATLMDALILERLAALFDLRIHDLSVAGLTARATVNAILGATLFEMIDRRRQREWRP
jgi:rod shape-determining protein MreD